MSNILKYNKKTNFMYGCGTGNTCNNMYGIIEVTDSAYGTDNAGYVVISQADSTVPTCFPPYAAENSANKRCNLLNPNNVTYPTTLAVANALTGESTSYYTKTEINYYTGTTAPITYLGINACASNSAKLGAKLPAYYLNTGSTITLSTCAITAGNALCLDGHLPAYYATSGATIYTLNSPATCTVGGVTPGYVLTGKPLQCIIQDAFAPYIAPTFSAFDFNVTSPIEVGAALLGSKTFTWSTTTSANICTNSIGICEVGGAVLGTGISNSGSCALSIGTKTNTAQTTWTWQITGCSTHSVGFNRNVSKCSIYPYYWGKITAGSRPAVTNIIVTGGTKVIVNSIGIVTIAFNSGAGDYTWFAIPATSTSKTCWYRTALDNGFMNRGCSTDKYPDECQLCITSGQGCWSNVCYKVYMSGGVGEIDTAICFS